MTAERQTFIQIDVEPRHTAWTYPVDVALVGDARTVLRQLGSALSAAGVQRHDVGRQRRNDVAANLRAQASRLPRSASHGPAEARHAYL